MNLDESPFESPRIVCRECESEEEHEFCNGFGWLERIRRGSIRNGYRLMLGAGFAFGLLLGWGR